MGLKVSRLIFLLLMVLGINSLVFGLERISTTPIEPGHAKRILIQDSIVYIFDCDYNDSISVSLFNAVDPYAPTFITRFENIAHSGHLYGTDHFAVKDSFIIVPNYDSELIYKLSSSYSLGLVAVIDYEPGSYLVRTEGSLLFLGQMWGGINLYDISDIYTPEYVTTVEGYAIGMKNFEIFDSLLVITDGFHLRVYLIENPDSIIQLSSAVCYFGDWWFGEIDYNEGFLYWATLVGVYVLDIRDHEFYEMYPGGDAYKPDQPLYLEVYDSLLVVCGQSHDYLYFNFISKIINDTLLVGPIDSTHVISYAYVAGDFKIRYPYLFTMSSNSLIIYDLESITGIAEKGEQTQEDAVEITQVGFNHYNIKLNCIHPAKLRVFDILGRLKIEGDIYPGSNYLIDSQEFKNTGVYLLNITGGNLEITRKLLIVK